MIDQKNKSEAALVAQIIQNPDEWYRVRRIVREEMFEDALMRRVFYVIDELVRGDYEVSVDIVTSRLGEFTDVSVPDDFIYDLWKNTYGISVEDSAKWIYNRWVLKELGEFSLKLGERLVDAGNHKEVIAWAMGEMMRYRMEEGGRVLNLSDVVRDVVTGIDKKKEDNEEMGLSIGFETFDRKVGRLQAGDMFVLAADAGGGKTTLVMNVAYNLSRAGKEVGFISCEMTGEGVAILYLSVLTKVPTEKIRSGELSVEEMELLRKTVDVVDKVPVRIIEREMDLDELMAAAMLMRGKWGIELLIIDYIQLIRVRGAEDGYMAVTKAVSEIKGMLLKMGIPAIVISQLSRKGMLKMSGQIDQDADIIAYIKNPDNGNDERILEVRKNRGGSELFNVSLRARDRRFWEYEGGGVIEPQVAVEEIDDLPF